MGSMAFWYEKSKANTGEKPKAVMNFNLWTQCNSGEASFLDIGFVVSNIKAASKLYFYIPFSDAKIKDLSNNINTSKSISVIFNEKYSVIDSSETRRFWPVTDTDDKVEFVIYSWGVRSDNAVKVISEEKDPGVTVEIDADKIIEQINNIKAKRFQDTDNLYFRFRVEIPEPAQKDTIVRKYSPPNSFLQSTWATTYIVDFRFDDLRSLPEEISSKTITQKTEFVPVTKLHFLLMTKAHVDVETGARDLTLRELEENTWDEYIDKRFETKDVVAYHCAVKQKEEKPIYQWEFFAKIKVNNSTAKVVFLYLWVLAGLTILFNCLSNGVWLLIENDYGFSVVMFGLVYFLICYFLMKDAIRGPSKKKRNRTVDKRK